MHALRYYIYDAEEKEASLPRVRNRKRQFNSTLKSNMLQCSNDTGDLCQMFKF